MESGLINVGRLGLDLLNPRFGRIRSRRGRWPQPTKVIFREIDINITGRKIEIKYINKSAPATVTNHRAFRTLVESIANNGVLPSAQATVIDNNTVTGQPPLTPLSLRNDELVYVVFLLSRTKDWQFSKDFDPISTSVEIAADEVFFDARRVHPNDGIIDRDDEKDGCNVAYMIAYGSKSLAMDDNAAPKYSHAFNLHVDILGLNQSTPPNILHRIPLIIDPDVRHPGGSSD